MFAKSKCLLFRRSALSGEEQALRDAKAMAAEASASAQPQHDLAADEAGAASHRPAQRASLKLAGAAIADHGVGIADAALKHPWATSPALLENISDIIVVASAEGVCAYVSSNIKPLCGYEAPELIGKPLFRFLHPLDRDQFKKAAMDATASTDTSRREEFRFRSAQGSWLTMECMVRAVTVQGRTNVVMTLYDITELKIQQAKALRLDRSHAVLSGIYRVILSARKRSQLMEGACRIAVEEGRLPAAWIGILGGEELRPACVYGASAAELGGLQISLRGDGMDANSPFARALHSGERSVSNDVANDPTMSRWHQALGKLGCASCAVYPLHFAGKVVGCLCLYGGDVGHFDEQELRQIAELVGHLSYAMEVIADDESFDCMAIHDPLTGLPNRTLFLQNLRERLQPEAPRDPPPAVLMVDVDRFKTINELLGRSGGDELLRQLASRVQRIASPSGCTARVGPDRFAVALPAGGLGFRDGTGRPDPNWASLSEPFSIGTHQLRLSYRTGFAQAPDDGTDAEALLLSAEGALKYAKSTSIRRVRHSNQISTAVAEKVRMENALRQALDRQEFVLHYQPKVKVATGTLCGVEALIRWNSPQRGFVMPQQFIPVLEETGMILEVGRWALLQAAADHRRWLAETSQHVRVAVNISAVQLREADFVQTIRSALSGGCNNQPGLELEITESQVLEDIDGAVEKLQTLRDLGLSVAIDDFGTGQSSLACLARLPVDVIKIDRAFTIRLPHCATTMSIVSAITALARSLKLKVVAEGVESAEQFKLLKLLQCDEAQGFLFARAVPAAEISDLLTGARSFPLTSV